MRERRQRLHGITLRANMINTPRSCDKHIMLEEYDADQRKIISNNLNKTQAYPRQPHATSRRITVNDVWVYPNRWWLWWRWPILQAVYHGVQVSAYDRSFIWQKCASANVQHHMVTWLYRTAGRESMDHAVLQSPIHPFGTVYRRLFASRQHWDNFINN